MECRNAYLAESTTCELGIGIFFNVGTLLMYSNILLSL